jgi:outer membrane biosynthesis protein TonB
MPSQMTVSSMTRSVDPPTFESDDALRRSVEPPELWLVRLFGALVLHLLLLAGVRSAWVQVSVPKGGEGGTIEFVEVGTVESAAAIDPSPKAEGVAPLQNLKPGQIAADPDQTTIVAKPTNALPSPSPSAVEPAPQPIATPQPIEQPEPVKPEVKPSSKPVESPQQPSVKPTVKPSIKPTVKPSTKPTAKPSTKPTEPIDRPVASGGQLPAPGAVGSKGGKPSLGSNGAPPPTLPMFGIEGQVESRKLLSRGFGADADMAIQDPLPRISLPLTEDFPSEFRGQTVTANFIVIAGAFKAGELTSITEVGAERTDNPLLKAGFSEAFITRIGEKLLVGRQVKITLIEKAGDDPNNPQNRSLDRAVSEWRVVVQIQFS